MAEDRLSFLKTQLRFPQSLYNRPKWNLVLEHIRKLDRQSEILDIGFGYPFLANFVGQEYDIYGIDNEPEFLRNLDETHYRQGNIEEQIPFEDNKFDCVVMLELIEHLANVNRAYEEIRKVLKPGGVVLISTPNYSLLPGLLWKAIESTYFRMFAKGYSKIEEHHTNKYSKHRLSSELRQYFDYVEVRAFSYKLGLFAICK